jgi:hypothetical protein
MGPRPAAGAVHAGDPGARPSPTVDPQAGVEPAARLRRYAAPVEMCRRPHVLTPKDPCPVWAAAGGPVHITALLLLYDRTLTTPGTTRCKESPEKAHEAGIVCTDEFLPHPHPRASRQDRHAARVEEIERRPTEATGSGQPPPVPANHRPPVRRPTEMTPTRSPPSGAPPCTPPTGTPAWPHGPSGTGIRTPHPAPPTTARPSRRRLFATHRSGNPPVCTPTRPRRSRRAPRRRAPTRRTIESTLPAAVRAIQSSTDPMDFTLSPPEETLAARAAPTRRLRS